MKIIPRIQKCEEYEKVVVLPNKYAVATIPDGYGNVMRYLKSFVEVSNDFKNTIKFLQDTGLRDEEYKIEVDDKITVTSNGAEGAYRALSTLKQLIRMKKVKKQSIHDYPHIKNRGIMLDISRGKLPQFKTLLEIVDMISDLKYNQLQLYIDGFVFEYEHFKKHCEGMHPLTVKEIEEFQKYCEDRFISLVPNQNSFGHMEKWLEKDDFKQLGIVRDDNKPSDTLNPLNKKTFEFVDTIYSDLLPYFKSPYINVGMDETISIGMGQTKKECEEKGKEIVYVEFLNKVFELANKKYNKVPMFWDDIVFENSDVIKEIKGECIFMDWGYDTEAAFSERCRLLQELGLKFYTCPGTSSWASFTGRFDNAVYNIESAARACVLYGGEGFLLTDWGDGGNPQFLPMSVLLYTYGASCSWNFTTIRDCRYSFISNAKEYPLIKWCEAYVDEFIFGRKGIGKLLHKMANYYLLENNNYFNETILWRNFPNVSTSEDFRHDMPELKMIMTYMKDIYDMLCKYDCETPYIEEIKCNCEMVILFAQYVHDYYLKDDEKIVNPELKNNLINLKENFVKLWRVKNRDAGYEIFCESIDKAINLID